MRLKEGADIGENSINNALNLELRSEMMYEEELAKQKYGEREVEMR